MQIGFNFVGELKTVTVGNSPTECAAKEVRRSEVGLAEI